MKRVLRKSLTFGASAGATLLSGGFTHVFAAEKKPKASGLPDLVAVKGKKPDTMFDEGIILQSEIYVQNISSLLTQLETTLHFFIPLPSFEGVLPTNGEIFIPNNIQIDRLFHP